jgi:hypothetical protein
MDNMFFTGQFVFVVSPNYDKGSKKIKRSGIVYGIFTHHITIDFDIYKESFTKKDIALGIVQIIPKTITKNTKEELPYVAL